MMSMSFAVVIILLCVTSIKTINIARIDGEQELVVYINGLPLMAGGAYNMPAYQQLWNVMTNQGEIIPASVRYEKVGYNGRLRVLNQPRVFHMRIAIVRIGGARSGTNISTPGIGQPPPPPLQPQPPPLPPQTLSTTASPPSPSSQTSQTTVASTTTEATTTPSAPTSSAPDTSSATAATTEAASTLPENASEESTAAGASELPSTPSSEVASA